MMIRNSKTSSHARAGLTLVEVIAAVAILSIILVSVVLAKARHTRQLAMAQQLAAAVPAADELIASWWLNEQVPINEGGPVPGASGLRWETREVRNLPVEELGGRVVRVAVFGAAAEPNLDADEPVLTVDLVLPQPRDETESPEPQS